MKRTPKIGAYVLETLTTGMYVDPLDTVRELVQNAADSIRKAEESQVLGRNAGRIEMRIGHNNRSLEVRDNGLGIPADAALEQLLNVGMSDKDIEQDAGFRGIGRLAGIAFCDSLRFRTSTQGETTATVLDFDSVGIRKAISPRNRRKREMADVLAKYSEFSTEKCRRTDHFFEVTMLGIADSTTQFLDPTALEMYLSESAPVDFDPQDFVFAPKIQRWARKHRLPLPTVSLTIATPSMSREVFKPYRTTYATSHQRTRQFEVTIEDVAFYPEQVGEKSRFWIWYGVSDLPGRIGDQRVAGFRLRKNNISLGGSERVTELFREITADSGRFNAYYVGEIHVLCPNAIPNARRDGFENVGSWPRIRGELLPFVQERRSQAYEASKARNLPVQKITASAEQTLAKAETSISVGIASQDERDKRLKEVRKERERVEQWVDAHKKPEDSKKVRPFVKRLQDAETRLQDEKNFVAQKARSSLDRKQRKLLQDVVSIVYSTLEGQSCKRATQCAEAVRRAISRKYGKS